MSSTAEAALALWTHEPASRPDRARIRARIAGMHCSLCTGTIEKALGRHPGVEKVAVSLTHEQALVEYDPRRVHPQDLLQTLKEMGYTISDPRKLERWWGPPTLTLITAATSRLYVAPMVSLFAAAMVTSWLAPTW